MTNVNEKALAISKKFGGKLEVISKVPIETMEDLSIAYTPGVAAVCMEIANNKESVYTYTTKKNLVAVVTDGSAVLGLGNIGPEAAIPVMEGKAALFKRFGNVDAVPISLNTQDVEEIISHVAAIAPSFGGINLEDISAPRCFEIERRLKEMLDIPVFHDDQHGTAIIVLAALYNSLRLTGKKIDEIQVVVNGGGAAGIAISQMFLSAGIKNLMVVDRTGIISETDPELAERHVEISKVTNRSFRTGTLEDAVVGMDVFVGVSAPGVLKKEWIATMNENRSSSRWRTRHRKSSRMKQKLAVPTSSAQAAATSRTKSTMCSPSRESSAEPWMPVPKTSRSKCSLLQRAASPASSAMRN